MTDMNETPTDPTQPVTPTDPTQPVTPTDPTQPVTPTDPTQPVGEAPMNEARRAVPNVAVDGEESLAANRAFYGALGFEEVMDLGWVMTMASPAQPTAQINFVEQGGPALVVPDMSVEVSDVDAAYAAMVAAGADIVRELQNERWGVRRFFVRDPQGKVVNVVAHAPVGG